MSFVDIQFPKDFEYASDGDNIPIEFYLDVLPRSRKVYLKLGYFSSKAIQVLSYGFAQFIHNGGVIKIVSNHFLYADDKELLVDDAIEEKLSESLLSDLKWMSESLDGASQHFMDCMKFLVKHKRLEIIPVMLKPSRMAHYKQGVFVDELENEIFMDGSCNFTANGLLENGENISVYRSWGSEFEKNKVDGKKGELENIISRENTKYVYLKIDDIVDAVVSLGRDKDVVELLSGELGLIKSCGDKNVEEVFKIYSKNLQEKIEMIEKEPRFPFIEGPRKYQREAYDNWVENSRKGIFAMATGTGKTITALNCLLNEYSDNECYQAVILVPSKPLLRQWGQEVRSFNFKNVVMVSSDFSWRDRVSELNTSLAFNKKQSFVMIVTYLTFATEAFQEKTSNFPNDTLLIADEAHNIGSNKMKLLMPSLNFEKRIALSATPKRRFDEEGNLLIERFFNSTEPYTYVFSMERAIREKILCQYDYYPHIIYLTESEMVSYAEISKKLARLFDKSSNSFKNPEAAKMLLLDRRRIIHKASKKLSKFNDVIDLLMQQRGGLDYSFVYSPEGDDQDGDNLLDMYMESLHEKYPGVKAHHYTSDTDNRSEVMDNFEKGYIDALFSMKCLDEGVDIPRAEVAIFCSSTGNPRQFIQRRGRVLRQHKDKNKAIIHDLIVVPVALSDSDSFSIEKNLMREELVRVVYFASLSSNYYEAMEKVKDISDYYDLNIYSLEEELRSKDDE